MGMLRVLDQELLTPNSGHHASSRQRMQGLPRDRCSRQLKGAGNYHNQWNTPLLSLFRVLLTKMMSHQLHAPHPSQPQPETLNLNHKASRCTTCLLYQVQLSYPLPRAALPHLQYPSPQATRWPLFSSTATDREPRGCLAHSTSAASSGVTGLRGELPSRAGSGISQTATHKPDTKPPSHRRVKSWTFTSLFWQLREGAARADEEHVDTRRCQVQTGEAPALQAGPAGERTHSVDPAPPEPRSLPDSGPNNPCVPGMHDPDLGKIQSLTWDLQTE